MKKIFFTTWGIVLIFSVFVLIGSTNKDIGRKLIFTDHGAYAVAGLYQESKLHDFKEHIPRVESPLTTKLEEAEIIAFGDSFVDISWGSPSFAYQLQEQTKRPVYMRVDYVDFNRDPANFNPLHFLESIKYKKAEKKYLVLETIERFALKNAKAYRPENKPMDTGFSFEKIVSALSWRMAAFDAWAKKHVIHINNDNYGLKYFFKENIISYPINYIIANIRFKLLGDVDPVIGAYSLKHKMLFYKESVDFNKRAKKEEDLDLVVNNVSYLSKELRDKYNLELIYVIVPNKNSIYNDYFMQKYTYDNFIPKVVEQLNSKGVAALDLYTEYMNYRQLDDSKPLYFHSDEHFNPLGKEILVNLVTKHLQSVSLP